MVEHATAPATLSPTLTQASRIRPAPSQRYVQGQAARISDRAQIARSLSEAEERLEHTTAMAAALMGEAVLPAVPSTRPAAPTRAPRSGLEAGPHIWRTATPCTFPYRCTAEIRCSMCGAGSRASNHPRPRAAALPKEPAPAAAARPVPAPVSALPAAMSPCLPWSATALGRAPCAGRAWCAQCFQSTARLASISPQERGRASRAAVMVAAGPWLLPIPASLPKALAALGSKINNTKWSSREGCWLQR